MHFKQFLENRENLHSWLSPKGEFFPLFGHYNHGSWAQSNHNAQIDQMWKKGWFRINYYGTTLYAHNETMPLNQIQTKELIDSAIENHMEKVVWDSGNDEKVLWTAYDDHWQAKPPVFH